MNRRIEKGFLTSGEGGRIEWARVRTPEPRGIIFAPPLIGGKLSQQVQSFRWLVRKGFDLISFNFSGHGNSSGRFSLSTSLWDTEAMLGLGSAAAEKEGLPLISIASCYSAIPLLNAAHALGEPLGRIILINAIPRLCPSQVLDSFMKYYRGYPAAPHRVGRIIESYLELLFPAIAKDRNRFGVLERERTRVLATLLDFFTRDPLRGISLTETPVLSVYSREDAILRIFNRGSCRDYRSDILRLCPRARFHSLDGDHFISSPAVRKGARARIDRFLSEADHSRSQSCPAAFLA